MHRSTTYLTNTCDVIDFQQQIFWSGTYGLAQEYAAQGRRGFTLESTMIGYILNDVTWCGTTSSPGINFESCPAFASCPDHVMASFWAKALESVSEMGFLILVNVTYI